jgi:hypothetical protein
MKNLVKITKAQALELFLNLKGHPFSYFATLSNANLTGGKKTLANFGGIVYKFARYTFVMNRDYLQNIEKTLSKKGIDFANWEPEAHKYATHIKGNVLCHNDDLNKDINDARIYIQFILHKGCNIESTYFDGKFKEIDIEKLKPYFRDNSSKKQSEIGIEKNEQVPVINFKLDSIFQFTLNGTKYEVIK